MPFAASTSFVAAYDRSGQPLSLIRSEPVRRIAITSGQSSTTEENNKDKVTLSESGIEKSRQPEDAERSESNDLAPGEKQTGREAAANDAIFRTPLDLVA